MKSFKIDETGDLVIKDNEIEIVDKKDEILQQLRLIFKSNQGEWYFNPEYGLNYKNILTKKPNFDLIRDEIKNGLSQCSDVMSIDYVDVSFDKNLRKLIIEFQATDVDGNTITETNIEI